MCYLLEPRHMKKSSALYTNVFLQWIYYYEHGMFQGPALRIFKHNYLSPLECRPN